MPPLSQACKAGNKAEQAAPMVGLQHMPGLLGVCTGFEGFIGYGGC
jgi:hypothetical protein